MKKTDITIELLTPKNIEDRLYLCWGHREDWKTLEIVQESRKWLKNVSAHSALITYIAYKEKTPVGMIEVVSVTSLKKFGLCSCRWEEGSNYPSKNEIERLTATYPRDIFLSCLWVKEGYQRQGVGSSLLGHFLTSELIKKAEGVLVYVHKPEATWDAHFHWPVGPRDLYLKRGFVSLQEINSGYLLRKQIVKDK